MERLDFSYSIWLMPEGEMKKRVWSIIKTHHEKYNSPLFEPHVTLIGGFIGKEKEMKNKAEMLASKLNTFTVKIEGISYLDEFFRSLFFKVEKGLELLEARKRAEKVFCLKKEAYMPHMSLVYGNFELKDKQEMMKNIDHGFSAEFKVKKIHIVTNDEKNFVWTVKESYNLSR